jgi:hypothetical protein
VRLKKIVKLLAGLLLLFGTATDFRAQQLAASTLRGVVTDPNGAVVPAATVRVTRNATGTSRETVTNAEGPYVLSNLEPGEYEVRVEARGFATRVSKAPVPLLVGQSITLDATLELDGLGSMTVDLIDGPPLVDTNSSKVDRVIDEREIANLPLNGRNFLELALLTPGNAPAPNFDPTKSNTILISSAGQFGRGGSVTIDGADTNDDVVGGAMQNISQDAVREFQIATSRFDASLGRSGSSVVNIVTKSGTNRGRGSASLFFRDSSQQGLPATFDRAAVPEELPFDRQQYSFTTGGPLKKDKLFFFGSVEYRNRDGAVLVGARDTAARRIRRGFAAAPLNDLLSTERLDWNPTILDSLTFRYSLQRADDAASSSLIRSLGSASQRQAGRNHAHSFLLDYTRVLSPRELNSFKLSYNTFSNLTEPVAAGAQLKRQLLWFAECARAR